jgi:hypothetical protein
MAADSALFIGWNRPVRGKEKEGIELFQSSMAFYAKQVQAGAIESFEPILLDTHGGDLNGFVLIKGTAAKLDAFQRSEEFQDLVVRGMLLIDSLGVIRGMVGEGVMKQISRIQKHI